MCGNYYNSFTDERHKKFRCIIQDDDFERYFKSLKIFSTIKIKLKNFEEKFFGPILKIEAFNHLELSYNLKPIIEFDLQKNKILFYEIYFDIPKRIPASWKNYESISLNDLDFINELTTLTLRYLSLLKEKNDEKRKKILQTKEYTKFKKANPELYKKGVRPSLPVKLLIEDDLLERFIILLFSNYEYLLFTKGDIYKAIEKFNSINDTLDLFSSNNLNYLKTSAISNLFNAISKSSKIKLVEPSLEGLKELLTIQEDCFKKFELTDEQKYKYCALKDEYISLLQFITSFEEKYLFNSDLL